MGHWLGIDVGGTKLLSITVDPDGATRHTSTASTGRDAGPDVILGRIEAAARDAQRAVGPLSGIGIGFPGLVDWSEGIARSSVILEGWSEVPLAALASQAVGVPAFVDNDVNQAARAEMLARGWRESTGCEDFVFLTVGTGIGGALVLAGDVWPGASGLAGELGHVSVDRSGPPCGCGRRGCVGPVASGAGIEGRLGIEAGSLARFAADHPDRAWPVVEESAQILGEGLASVMNVLNPPLVVIGGGVAELGPRYIDAVARASREVALPEIAGACRFEVARAGYEAGAVGAAHFARRRCTPRRAPRGQGGAAIAG